VLLLPGMLAVCADAGRHVTAICVGVTDRHPLLLHAGAVVSSCGEGSGMTERCSEQLQDEQD
jgi:hypothetical protein